MNRCRPGIGERLAGSKSLPDRLVTIALSGRNGEAAVGRCSALCSAPHKADYVDHLIMWSCHSELPRKSCAERLFQSDWLYIVVIISGV